MTRDKQSSVEWLVEQLSKYNEEMIFLYQNEIEQAKAMHKEEIKNAFDVGSDSYYDLSNPSNSEDYYNETFGGNNEQE